MQRWRAVLCTAGYWWALGRETGAGGIAGITNLRRGELADDRSVLSGRGSANLHRQLRGRGRAAMRSMASVCDDRDLVSPAAIVASPLLQMIAER